MGKNSHEDQSNENQVNFDVMSTSDNSKLLIDTVPQIEDTPDVNQFEHIDNNQAEWEMECNPDAQLNDYKAIETS